MSESDQFYHDSRPVPPLYFGCRLFIAHKCTLNAFMSKTMGLISEYIPISGCFRQWCRVSQPRNTLVSGHTVRPSPRVGGVLGRDVVRPKSSRATSRLFLSPQPNKYSLLRDVSHSSFV